MNPSQVFRLNEQLLQWAFALNRNGSNLSDTTFWHGAKMTESGNAWTSFWTDGEGSFTTRTMEDSGTLQALRNLDHAGKVDFDRVMILRTASNCTMQSPDMTAAQSLARERGAAVSAYAESIEAAFRVGNPVVQAITQGWATYQDTIPGGSTHAP